MKHTEAAQRTPARPEWVVLGLLFLASLLVRTAVWWPVAASGVPLLYDESGYLARARGFALAFQHVVGLGSGVQTPLRDALAQAYGGGIWPPLYPGLLAAGLLVAGPSAGVARLVTVLISAATTPVAYLLGSTVYDRRSGLGAALVHILYPGFVGFSHFLWSESAYIFFALLAAYFTVQVVRTGPGRPRTLCALACGAAWGLAALVRPSALLGLLVALAFLATSVKEVRWRATAPALAAVACVLIVLPWQVALMAREKGFPILSTSWSGWSLYSSNNPWGQSAEADARAWEEAERYAQAHSVPRDAAARALAIQYIKEHPGAFLAKCARNLRLYWLPDAFVRRHVFTATYPPMAAAPAVLVWAVTVVGFLLLSGLATFGLATPGGAGRGLLVALVLTGLVLPLATETNTRYALPLLGFLLPFAGHGLASLGAPRHARWRAAAAASAAVVALMVLNTAGYRMGLPGGASSYYSPLLGRAGGIVGGHTSYWDQVLFRKSGEAAALTLRIAVRTEGYRVRREGKAGDSCTVALAGSATAVELLARDAAGPPEIEVSCPESGRTALVRPVAKESWRQWKPTGLDGVEYLWTGGVPANQEEAAPWIGQEQ